MIVTEELLVKGMSLRGSWSLDQLRALGVSIPLESGWRKRLIGAQVSEAQVAEFLRLKNQHMTQKGLAKIASRLMKGEDPQKRGVELLKKEQKKRLKKTHDVDPIIAQRAQSIVDTFTEEGKASGSHITTCTKEQCLFPACYCS